MFGVKSIVLVGIIALSACGNNKEKKQNELLVETISVKTAQVQTKTSRTVISTTGLITTQNEAKYAFKIGGVIDKIYVKEGQFFKKGELMARLKLTEIDASLSEAKLGFEKAQRDYLRVKNLYKDSVATLEQLQNTKTGLDIAQKQLDAVTFNQKYACIYAANAGFVTQKLANEGEVIAAGSPVFIINENTNAGWILKAGLTDQQWASVDIGDKAIVNIDAYPNQTFRAKVSKKLLSVDPYSGSFPIELTIEIGNAKPAVGMYATAMIETKKQSNLFIIPYDALIEADGNQAFVFVPFNNTQVKKIPVVIESFDNTVVKIASGLENVKEVIISNSAFLNENSAINIVK